MQTAASSYDDPRRGEEIRRILRSKPFLSRFYEEIYAKYRSQLALCPPRGIALELGSGAGFAKSVVPGLVTSDIVAYDGVDRVVDATKLPFEDETLRAILLWDTFHHIPDVEAFLREADRCLLPGGRLFMTEPYPGWIGAPAYKYLHPEPYDADTASWSFETSGPVSGANIPLAWIVFERDLVLFKQKFPRLRLAGYRPHSPLRYWLSGGLTPWSLLPAALFPAASLIDRLLIALSPRFASFVDIEIVKC